MQLCDKQAAWPSQKWPKLSKLYGSYGQERTILGRVRTVALGVVPFHPITQLFWRHETQAQAGWDGILPGPLHETRS